MVQLIHNRYFPPQILPPVHLHQFVLFVHLHRHLQPSLFLDRVLHTRVGASSELFPEFEVFGFERLCFLILIWEDVLVESSG